MADPTRDFHTALQMLNPFTLDGFQMSIFFKNVSDSGCVCVCVCVCVRVRVRVCVF